MSEAERDHIILLGTVASSPKTIMEAIESGDFFDPMHTWQEGGAGRSAPGRKQWLSPVGKLQIPLRQS